MIIIYFFFILFVVSIKGNPSYRRDDKCNFNVDNGECSLKSDSCGNYMKNIIIKI